MFQLFFGSFLQVLSFRVFSSGWFVIPTTVYHHSPKLDRLGSWSGIGSETLIHFGQFPLQEGNHLIFGHDLFLHCRDVAWGVCLGLHQWLETSYQQGNHLQCQCLPQRACLGMVGCTPIPTYTYGKSLQNGPILRGYSCFFVHPQESLENTINTICNNLLSILNLNVSAILGRIPLLFTIWGGYSAGTGRYWIALIHGSSK